MHHCGLPGVPNLHHQALHALPHLDVLVAAVFRLAGDPGLVLEALRHEPAQRLLGENVASPARHVALLHVGLELAAEVERLGVVVGLQQVAEVLHHHVGVVVRLEEPVRLVPVVLVEVDVSLLGLGPQVVAALLHVEPHGGQVGVGLGAHEDQLVAPPAPGGLHVAGLAPVVLGARHDPAENPHTSCSPSCDGVLGVVHQLGWRAGKVGQQALQDGLLVREET